MEKEEVGPEKQPPDKFKVPNPKPRSAFKRVPKPMSTSSQGVTSKLNQAGSLKDSTYGYILMKALKNPTDITPNEKMILVSHPVIAELIEQTNGMKHTQKLSCYVNIDTIFNYQYYHSAEIPVLYDSHEK
mmetsp:Transcript_34188/g.33778  ORF Transcript_34188/g.33778 Transcript_34188/m.33778 type:complete len:130 (+) Transcript_34188:24-413(+)